jgi:hypothetical protein
MIELTHFSVVVLAQAHNPTILNPDFLKHNNIVSEKFTVKNFICTPPIAQVSYAEGISIVAEFEKIQFIDETAERLPNQSPIPTIAIKYIETLPHVNYTAAGINFMGHFKFKNAESVRTFIIKKFVKGGPWLLSKDEIVDVGLNFVYSDGNMKRTININPGEYKKAGNEPIPVIALRYNQHFEAKDKDRRSIEAFIADWEKAFSQYAIFDKQIFAGE